MRTSGSALCGLLGQGSTASTILLDLLVCQVLDSDESVVSMRAANQFIQLSLQCTSIPVLSVLNDKNHQKCHDSGSSIDNELPRIRVVEDRTCETPTDDNQDSKKRSTGSQRGRHFRFAPESGHARTHRDMSALCP